MVPFVIVLFWWVVGAVGVLLVYASFSYETEDGKVQNRLEEWWVRIDDVKNQAISVHIAFVKVTASVISRFLDRLFGPRVLSLQSLGVSACYSVVFIAIAILVLNKFFNPKPESATSSFVWLILFGLVYGSLPALGDPPKRKRSGLRFVHFWFVGLLFIFIWNFLEPFGYVILYGLFNPEMRRGAFALFAILIGILFSIFLFATFIGIMRITLRTIARTESALKIVGLSLINSGPIITFYGLIKLVEWWPNSSSKTVEVGLIMLLVLLICGILFNFAFLFSAILFICLAATMLLHRLFWPAIARPLYKLQALGIAKRPKVFAVAGLILIGVALGNEWFWFLFNKLPIR